MERATGLEPGTISSTPVLWEEGVDGVEGVALVLLVVAGVLPAESICALILVIRADSGVVLVLLWVLGGGTGDSFFFSILVDIVKFL